MRIPNEEQQQSDNEIHPSVPAKKPFKGKLVPGPEVLGPLLIPRKKLRVASEERLTTEELKSRFATNLDRLIGLLGITRKQAASDIGITYKLVRRLVSAGVSRADERSKDDVAKIAAFFALPA